MSVYRFEREGSWTAENREQANEKKLQHLKIEIDWLEDFDKETLYQYTKIVAKSAAKTIAVFFMKITSVFSFINK